MSLRILSWVTRDSILDTNFGVRPLTICWTRRTTNFISLENGSAKNFLTVEMLKSEQKKLTSGGVAGKTTQGKLNYWSCLSLSPCCLFGPSPRLSSRAVAPETSFREVLLALTTTRLMPAEGLTLLISTPALSLLCPTSRPALLGLSQADSGLTPRSSAVRESTCPVMGRFSAF